MGIGTIVLAVVVTIVGVSLTVVANKLVNRIIK